MENGNPPKYVRQTLLTLEGAGFRAYMVGGCVRDLMMGKRPADWDLCTNALPGEVQALFPRAVPSGLRHGTVTVCQPGGRVEVTTFRTESGYADHRRPDRVGFVDDLREDLMRRDFTINAMALSLAGSLSDPFGGRTDLERRLVRCVGEAKQRFAEDALRMFRALRFSARLGFEMSLETAAAIEENAPLAECLAPERVRDELEKILLSPRPELLGQAVAYGLLTAYGLRSNAPNLSVLRTLPRKRLLRWCALGALLQRDGLIESTEKFLAALRLEGAAVRCCAVGSDLAMRQADADTPGRKRILARFGEETALCCAAASAALGRRGSLQAMRAVMGSGECVSLRQLAVNGDDLLPLGFSGKALGEALWALLEHVLARPEDNRRETLLALAEEILS
jgi:tRNA nucleotidyltransferase (CCA-adding enzyme)